MHRFRPKNPVSGILGPCPYIEVTSNCPPNPKIHQNRLKILPKCPHSSSENAPKSAQTCPKSTDFAPKRPFQTLLGLVRTLNRQIVVKCPQNRPQNPSVTPKPAQNCPKSPDFSPKRPPACARSEEPPGSCAPKDLRPHLYPLPPPPRLRSWGKNTRFEVKI